MASAPLQSSRMELWGESSISKPEPLRIIKERTKTFTGCDASAEVSIPRREFFGSTNASGSSPEAPKRALTIHKMRRTRGLTMDSSTGSNDSSVSSIETLAAPYCGASSRLDLKSSKGIRNSKRTASVGSFIKSELLRRTLETESDITRSLPVRKLSKSNRKSINSFSVDLFTPPIRADQNEDPNRRCAETPGRLEKHPKLISKAFGSVRSKSMHFLRPKPSRESLLRHVSLKNHQASIQSSLDTPCLIPPRFSFELNSVDIANLRGSFQATTGRPDTALNPSFILYPKITIVPEADSVNAQEESSIWVAIMLTGTLKEVGGSIFDTGEPSQENGRPTLTKRPPDNTDHGYLYNVEIKLVGLSDCTVEAVIPDNDGLRALRCDQTEVVLARVKLPVAVVASSHVRESSLELIDELESHLGNKVTSYLGITVSYKHSAFPTFKGLIAEPMGMSYHATILRTEAHASIKRHCSDSKWAIRNGDVPSQNSISDLLIPIITAHYDSETARAIITQITSDNPLGSILEQRQVSNQSLSSTCRTVIQMSRNVSQDSTCKGYWGDDDPPGSAEPILEANQAEEDGNIEADFSQFSPEESVSPDPARKIWSEMRKNSRGVSDSPRSGTLGSESGLDEVSDVESEMEAIFQQEKARIMEMVVRNKRSVGADTLRSIAAPAAASAAASMRASTAGSLRRPIFTSMEGSLTTTRVSAASGAPNPHAFGAGMQAKRGWGWGPPWW